MTAQTNPYVGRIKLTVSIFVGLVAKKNGSLKRAILLILNNVVYSKNCGLAIGEVAALVAEWPPAPPFPSK